MRNYTFYFAIALIISCFCRNIVNAQNEIPNIQPLFNKWLKNEKIEIGNISLKTLEKWNENDDTDDLAIVSLMDLNGDGKNEMAVQSDCVTVGNCELDIVKKNGETYKTLLSANMIQTVDVLKLQTHGFYDLKLKTHNSQLSHYYQLLKFNGQQYKARKCWWEDYNFTDRRGSIREVKKPRIRYVRCGEYDYVN